MQAGLAPFFMRPPRPAETQGIQQQGRGSRLCAWAGSRRAQGGGWADKENADSCRLFRSHKMGRSKCRLAPARRDLCGDQHVIRRRSRDL